MKLQLPPRINGSPETIETSDRPVTIVGANGSGKTRFAHRLAQSLGERAFLLKSINALNIDTIEDPTTESVNSLYHRRLGHTTLLRSDIRGELNRMIALMLHEEMLNLLEYKTRTLTDPGAHMQPTRLDRLTRLWHEVFPDNRILVNQGELLFSSPKGSDTYSVNRLSAGEMAVMYHIGCALYAPEGAMIFVDNPGMFLHPTIIRSLWDSIEQLRDDCPFVYITHDIDFVSSRGEGTVVWVRDYDPARVEWDYDILSPADGIPEDVYLSIIGARKPVLFIEGDGVNSIDAKLYPLVFKEYTVKSLGSCGRVIEATRAFNNLNGFHNLDSYGIVDRDRRDAHEVEYLRSRKVLVPDVAEIENILMLEEVVRTVASANGRDEHKAFDKVRRSIIKLFAGDLRSQALLHTRHRVKMTVERRIDGRFNNINSLETHVNELVHAINPRGLYEGFCREFNRYVHDNDYASILRVYNRKSMLAESNAAFHCGLKSHDKRDYIQAVLAILRQDTPAADRLRTAVKRCFGLAP